MQKHSHLLQKTGTFLTVLCAIHCLAMPFVLTALPFLGNYMSETAEHMLVVVSLFLAVIVLWKDYKIHQRGLPFMIFAAGSMLQLAGISNIFGIETPLVLAGSGFIVVAYYFNWRWHQKVCHHK